MLICAVAVTLCGARRQSAAAWRNPVQVAGGRSPRAPSMAAAASDFSLEELAYQYATDKSHDDHKYTDLCTPLSAPTRPLARCYA